MHLTMLPPQPFFQADKAVVADNEVIDQLDIEVASGGNKLFGDSNIFGQGRWVPAGVVVANKMPGLLGLIARR